MSGLKLAALCGFYPHKLGFCGLQENSAKKILWNYLRGEKTPGQKIRKILETFKGAFSYYKLIAKENGIKDPFDEKVVQAYWIGNQLLERVPRDLLKEMIAKDFVGPGLLSQETAEKKTKELPLTSKAHHSFHVLVLGSVTGRIVLTGKLLDLCRISWGRILDEKKGRTENLNRVMIKYQPLKKSKMGYYLGKPTPKIVFWDKKFIPRVKIGDTVAMHWNHIVKVLTKKDLVNLKKYTQITLDSLKKKTTT